MSLYHRFITGLAFFLAVCLLSGCNRENPALANLDAANSTSQPGASGLAQDGARFTEVAQPAGLKYRWVIDGKRPYNLLQTIGNGCAFLDYNRDGNLDILLVGPRLALYKNNGQGQFTDVSASAKLSILRGHFLGCATGDYDNDGYPDLYISAYRGGLLLHNERGQFFRNATSRANLKAQPWGTSCAFADINNDGRLDLYVANYVRFGPHTPQLCSFEGGMGACSPLFYLPERGVLYLNRGQGRFQNVTQSWGADSVTGKALGVAFADFNNSGRQSLAVANDGTPGDLLLNRGQKFENIGVVSGVAFDANGHTHAGMGVDWGDYDNDGRLDLVTTTFRDEPTSVYHNENGRLFTEMSASLGLAASTLEVLTFGAKWFDYDNDGWLDLALVNGHVRDNSEQVDDGAPYRQPSQLFRNRDGQRLVEVSDRAGEAWKRKIVGRGLATGDYDNDGRMDLLIADSEGAPLLMHNDTLSGQHWLGIQLIGSRSNRDGIGAMVTVTVAGRRLVRRCGTDGSYLSASDARVHFGLGTTKSPVSLTVRWPSGAITERRNVNVNQYLSIRETS